MSAIQVTQENYDSLKKAYNKAVAEKKEEFKWKEPSSKTFHGLVTGFAKYVLEYMESHSHIKKK